MDDAMPPPPRKKKTKSDIISHATVTEYVLAHSKSANGGWKGFFRSNLFAALILWCLSQAILIGGFFITFYVRTTQLAEWRSSVDTLLKRMDEQGTLKSHYNDEREDAQLAKHEVRLDKLEENTKHVEVIESEHRRLTKDVEDLRNGKK